MARHGNRWRGRNGQVFIVFIAGLLALAGCSSVPEDGYDPGPQRPPVDAPAPESTRTNLRFADKLFVCSGMTVSNGPRVELSGKVADFSVTTLVEGTKLAVNPAPGACLSSGYGLRDGRLHKGLDYWAAVGTPILAAGNGTVVEMTYRADYGNMILIDHGRGIYTRYAHLSAFGDGVEPGEPVRAGDVIGLMGNTSDRAIPVHLHYEILSGDIRTPKGSFGLAPVDPFGVSTAD